MNSLVLTSFGVFITSVGEVQRPTTKAKQAAATELIWAGSFHSITFNGRLLRARCYARHWGRWNEQGASFAAWISLFTAIGGSLSAMAEGSFFCLRQAEKGSLYDSWVMLVLLVCLKSQLPSRGSWNLETSRWFEALAQPWQGSDTSAPEGWLAPAECTGSSLCGVP